MAVVDAAGLKVVGPEFGKSFEVVRAVWDASVDDLTTTNPVAVLEAGADIVIHNFYMNVKTACTSGGSMTVDVGIAGGDEDILIDGVAVASLTAGALIAPTVVEGTPNVLAMPLKLASGGQIQMKKITAAATAGKIEFVFVVSKF